VRVNHSYMLSKVRVIPEADFFRVVLRRVRRCAVLSQTGVTGEPDPAHGERIFKLKGCCGLSHHRRQQVEWVRPGRGLRQQRHLCSPKARKVTLTADEDYLARSIHHPPKEVVKGFAPQMPKADLSDNDVAGTWLRISSLLH